MVFSCHLKFIGKGDTTLLLSLFNNVFNEGFIGVSFFFILSGFIISYTYFEKITKGIITSKEFIIARLARIYPLHILTLLLSLPFAVKELSSRNAAEWWKVALANITLTQSFFNDEKFYFSFNELSWSVSDELFFYISFPLLVFIYSKLKHKPIIYQIIIVIVVLQTIPVLMNVFKNINYHRVFFIFPITRLVDFILGIMLYFLFSKIKAKAEKNSFSILEFLSVLVFVVFFSFHSSVPVVYRYSVYYWIPMSLIIVVFAFQKGILSELLSNKYLVLLGEISFGFYLFHLLILNYFFGINVRLLHIENSYLIFLSIFTITLIVSYFSYRYYEKPLNKLIHKRWLSNN
jgi:peptidoglycan/LPS O-acetylase OafA/YrhL